MVIFALWSMKKMRPFGATCNDQPGGNRSLFGNLSVLRTSTEATLP